MTNALRNEDWLRTRRWDIVPATVDTLLLSLGVHGKTTVEQKSVVADFMKLPAAEAMPVALKQALRQRGLL